MKPTSKTQGKSRKVKIQDYVFLHEKHRKNAKSWQIMFVPVEMTITVPKNIIFPLTPKKGKVGRGKKLK